MKCGPCNRLKHLRCEGRDTWCDCCGAKRLEKAAVSSPSRVTPSNKGGSERTARSAPAPRPRKVPRPRITGAGTTCIEPGCEIVAKARGLCAKHYMRFLRHGDPRVTLQIGRPRGSLEEATVRYKLENLVVASLLFGKSQKETGKFVGIGSDTVRAIAQSRGLACAHPAVSDKMASSGIAEDSIG